MKTFKLSIHIFLIVFMYFLPIGCVKDITDISNIKLSETISQEEEIYKTVNIVNSEFILKEVKDVKLVAQLTGKGSLNETEKYGIHGADLGSMFTHNGKVYMVFGDTFGARPASSSGAGGKNWRNNTMAIISDDNPADGIKFDGMITDDKGIAKELLSSKRIDDDEKTIIPTYGFSTNGNMYLYYMSVKKWHISPGEWLCNYGGLAKSQDGGYNWTKLEDVKWPGDSNFIQVATYNIQNEVYFWAIPAGRSGGVKLMKVGETDVEILEKYRYFAGIKDNQPVWSERIAEAKEVVEGPVGELSVIWNEYLNRWIMTYLNKKARAIEIREGITPWGPWGKPILVCSGDQYPQLYGAYMHPKYVENNGGSIYFAMSIWNPYNVFWMKATLVKE